MSSTRCRWLIRNLALIGHPSFFCYTSKLDFPMLLLIPVEKKTEAQVRTDRGVVSFPLTRGGNRAEEKTGEEMAMPTFQLAPDLPPVSRLCFGSALNSFSLSLPCALVALC
jgi:hypothetical protein